MAKELRGHVPDVRVLKLNNDLKYRDPKDMEKLMELSLIKFDEQSFYDITGELSVPTNYSAKMFARLNRLLTVP